MKTSMSVLPAATRKECRKTKIHSLIRKLKDSLEKSLNHGFWFCQACEARCERIEGEQGQPAHCDLCGSHRIEYLPPITNALQTKVTA
jgi:transcription initiation factor IIE alpha subunit